MTATTRALPGRVFTVPEGQCLQVLEALLGRGRGDVVTVPVQVSPLSRELAAAGARRIATSVMRWLVEGGGWRERVVLRGGRRVRARAWDTAAGRGFAPRYTAASRALWIEGAAQLPALVGQGKTDATRVARKALRRVVPEQSTEVGDWVFFHLAQRALATFRLNDDDLRVLRERLVAQSPVALLLAPAGDRSRRELRDAFTRLTAPGTARVLECIEDRVTAAWSGAARGLWAERTTTSGAARIERWAGFGRLLDAYLDAVDDAGRLDLARPVTRFAAELTTGVFVAPPEAVRAEVSRSPWVASMAQRDELLAAVGSVAAVGQRVLALRERMAAERYGDARYAEAQVFVGDVDALLGGQRRAVEGLARAFTGAIG
ncbi:MAG: hypothetical protein Q7V43_23375 [Myxococcales bacterium]|nr:hypothetical protein [Myxococcales bacterium]